MYYMEDVTPKYDNSNNIQIKTYIPFAPIYSVCTFETSNNEKIQYLLNIPNSGYNILKFDDLRTDVKYSLCTCKFYDYYIDKYNDFNIYFQNNKYSSEQFPTKLQPCKDINRTPQCAYFHFNSISNSSNIDKFLFLSELYCYHKMSEDEPILSRIEKTVLCKSIKEQNIIKVCVGPSPLNTDKIYKNNFNKNYFFERFDKIEKKIWKMKKK